MLACKPEGLGFDPRASFRLIFFVIGYWEITNNKFYNAKYDALQVLTYKYAAILSVEVER